MRVMIYKRTHTGDPDESGCFGIRLCMGRVRKRDFDAVIGVGGVGREPIHEGIDRKITWIGIRPHQVGVGDDGYPLLAFEHFYLKDEKGLLLIEKAPTLAKRLFAEYGPRTLMVETNDEIETILRLAKRSPPSPALLGRATKPKRCSQSHKKTC